MSTFTRKLKQDGVPFCRYTKGYNYGIMTAYTKKVTKGRNYYVQLVRNKNGDIVNIIRHKK